MVHECAIAHFGGHLWISYPDPALHRQPRELTPDADVLGAFVETLDTAMDRRAGHLYLLARRAQYLDLESRGLATTASA